MGKVLWRKERPFALEYQSCQRNLLEMLGGLAHKRRRMKVPTARLWNWEAGTAASNVSSPAGVPVLHCTKTANWSSRNNYMILVRRRLSQRTGIKKI